MNPATETARPSEATRSPYLPTYGHITWTRLIAAVGAALGAPWAPDPDPRYYIGHQPAPVNMNSLNRIVSGFVAEALATAAPGAGAGASTQEEALREISRRAQARGAANPAGAPGDELRRAAADALSAMRSDDVFTENRKILAERDRVRRRAIAALASALKTSAPGWTGVVHVAE